MEKLILFILLMNFFFCSANTTAKEDNVEPKNELEMIKEPYYVVDFGAGNCIIEFLVNDVSAFSLDLERAGTATEIPINSGILESGIQQVAYRILPVAGEVYVHEKAYFYASIKLYDSSIAGWREIESFNRYEMPEKREAPAPAIIHETTFHAEVPYRQNAWQNSADLRTIPNLREMADAKYKEIEKILEAGDMEKFLEMIALRESNISKSFYLSEEGKKRRIDDLLDAMKRGFTVIPTSPSDKMVLSGFGKLVSLQNEEGEPALQIETDEYYLPLDIRLHLESGKMELNII